MLRLGWALGKTLGELAGMPAAELHHWLAFERLSGPLGPERGDLQAAQTPAAIASLFRGKGRPAVSPADLLPRWERARPAPAGAGKRAWAEWFRGRRKGGNRG